MKFKLTRVALVFLFVIFFISINFVGALLDNVTVSRADSIASNGSMAEFRKTVFEHPNNIPLQLVEQYYESIGPESMLDVVEENSLCHVIGHNIGRVIFLKTRNLEKSIEICRHRCTNGCFHGALMALFEGSEPENVSHSSDKPHDHITYDRFEKSALQQCDKPPLDFYKGDCYHALGHVSMYLGEYDIQKTMDFCQLFDNKIAAFNCAVGAYMEYTITKGAILQNGTYLCDAYTDFPAACFRYEFISWQNKTFDYNGAAEVCLALSDALQRAGCFHGLGFASFLLVYRQPDLLPKICSFGSRTDRRMCIDGAAGKLNMFYPEKQQEACTYLDDSQMASLCLLSRNSGMNKDPDLYYYVHNRKSLFSSSLSIIRWIFKI